MNHTIQLINANAIDGIKEVLRSNKWVDSIITSFNEEYFYEDCVEKTLIDLANYMSAVLVGDGTLYIRTAPEHIGLLIKTMSGPFNLLNILVIPKSVKPTCSGRSNYYNTSDVEYVLYFGQVCGSTRPLNNVDNKCTCKQSAYWSEFSGSTIDLYRQLMKLSTNHSDVILDPFMDAGDVGEAAILQDRHFIGIEVGAARLADAKVRLDQLGE